MVNEEKSTSSGRIFIVIKLHSEFMLTQEPTCLHVRVVTRAQTVSKLQVKTSVNMVKVSLNLLFPSATNVLALEGKFSSVQDYKY